MLVLVLGICTGCADKSARPVVSDAPILVVGMDGLEWHVLLPMVRKGEMPAFARLMERGVYGRLSTIEPTLSPVIWTSVATGKRPEKHGIVDMVLKDPGGGMIRPYGRRDRKTKAAWNIFSDFGMKVSSIGWWMTFPVEEIRGTMISQMNWLYSFRPDQGTVFRQQNLYLEGLVFPPEYQEHVMQIAVEENESLNEHAAAIFGEAFEGPHPPLVQQLWKNVTWIVTVDGIHLRVAKELLEAGTRPDLMMVYLRGADLMGHSFWRHTYPDQFEHPPPPEESARYGSVIPSYYRFLDRALGSLVKAAGEETLVLVLSDHGMEADDTEATFVTDGRKLVKQSAGGHDDAPPGVLIASGPGIGGEPASNPPRSADDLPIVGSVLDILPTLLTIKGLPVGRDMDGEVIRLLVDRPPTFVASHDTLEPIEAEDEGTLTQEQIQDRLEELRSLGYIQ